MRHVALPVIVLLAMRCATRPPAPQPITYTTQAECHPDVPLVDPRDPHVTPPKVISRVEPAIPDAIRSAHEAIDEVVIAIAIVDERGLVADVCPLKGDPRLLEPAMNALRQWKFAPGMIDGRPTPFRFTFTTRFRLH
jgi:Gram-negative bacterial TonB protein C-terminal